MAENDDEKTEAPSEKRRQEAREKGNVAKSTEINSVMVLLTAIVMLKILGPALMHTIDSSIVKFIGAPIQG